MTATLAFIKPNPPVMMMMTLTKIIVWRPPWHSENQTPRWWSHWWWSLWWWWQLKGWNKIVYFDPQRFLHILHPPLVKVSTQLSTCEKEMCNHAQGRWLYDDSLMTVIFLPVHGQAFKTHLLSCLADEKMMALFPDLWFLFEIWSEDDSIVKWLRNVV